jgi:biotin operon repressor
MPRYRGTKEGTPSLVGRLLLLVAGDKETSATLASKLCVSNRQVNRYVLQLNQAGWQIERRGTPTRGNYWFELVSPQIILHEGRKRRGKTRRRF